MNNVNVTYNYGNVALTAKGPANEVFQLLLRIAEQQKTTTAKKKTTKKRRTRAPVRKWTAQEDQAAYETYMFTGGKPPIKMLEELAKNINRTVSAIEIRAHNKGWTKK